LLEKAEERARELLTQKGPLKLHVFERDRHAPGEEPKNHDRSTLSAPFESDLRARDPDQKIFAKTGERATNGDRVLDLIWVEPSELWIGLHEQTSDHVPYAGGIPPMSLPEEAPSRAWLKIEEALLWSGARVRPRDQALEIGSAPGGATFNLLQRGLNVVGVDPAEMDPRVLHWKGESRFRHLRRAVQQLDASDLPQGVQWLLLDMNVSPNVSIDEISHIARLIGDPLLGVFLTIKLNKWRIAGEIPEMLEHLRQLGLARIRARQLSSNRQEFTVFGLTRKGLLRQAD
jgi:23S rRNA (cytidine2498-2'-O)-methyltransferase